MIKVGDLMRLFRSETKVIIAENTDVDHAVFEGTNVVLYTHGKRYMDRSVYSCKATDKSSIRILLDPVNMNDYRDM